MFCKVNSEEPRALNTESGYLDFILAVPLIDCGCKYVCACMCWVGSWCWWSIPLSGTLSLCVKWKGETTIVLCLPSPEFWETCLHFLFYRISGASVFLPDSLNTAFHRHSVIETVSLRAIIRGNRLPTMKICFALKSKHSMAFFWESLISSVSKYGLHSFIFHQFCFF